MKLEVYIITDRLLAGERPLPWVVEESLAGGAEIVQLREKNISTREFVELARRVKEIAGRYKANLIINDRVDVALAVGAEGVHLGEEDMPLKVAREILGRRAIIGMSVATVQEAEIASREGADYLGVGAIFSTPTKTEAAPVGLDRLKEIKKAVRLPLVAIGGINPGNAGDVIKAGADGIAVVSAVMTAESPRRAVEELREEARKAILAGSLRRLGDAVKRPG